MNKSTFALLALVFIAGGLFFASMDRAQNQKNKNQTPEESELFSENFPKETKDTTIFLGNIALNPNAIDCSKVFPVKRQIKNLPNVATLTVEKLLAGPNEWEKLHGYYSSLGEAEFNSLNIIEGVAIIDFGKLPSGGSCLVSQARAQIEETLRQFESVKEVVITVNGSGDGVLEP